MTVESKNTDSFVKKPPAEALAILVYGPDEGLIRERLDTLTKGVVADIHDPFNVAEFSAAVLEENPARLMDEARSISMLGGRRVVRVHGAVDGIKKTVEGLLAALRAGDNLVLLEAGELGKNSELRKLFEKAENAAALPCYVDDAGKISIVIGDALRTAGYRFSSEAITYMAANVTGDRAVARSEVEKLITYMGPADNKNERKNITLDDVIACVGNSADLSLDDLARHVASGQFAAADRILDYVLLEGLPAVTVLRTLQNHFLRLHITKARIQKGDDTEGAMKKLKPEVFWKVKDAFKSQLNGWSLGQMEQALALLAGVEAKCKQTANDPHTLCSRAILSLSQLGAKATGAGRRG
jgi:DNA polymerase-3 subunit delta